MKAQRCAELLSQLLRAKLARNDSSVTATEVLQYLTTARLEEEGGKGGGVPNTAHNRATGTPVSSSRSATGRSTATDTAVNSTAREDELARVARQWDEPGLTVQEVDLVSRALDYLSLDEVLHYSHLVLQKPELINRRRPPSIKTAFRTVKLVCKVLGVVYDPKRVDTWLTPFDLVWQRYYGASIPFGVAARELRPLCKQHGTLEVQRRLDIYCAATEAPYVSLPRFAMTWGGWEHPPSAGKGMRGMPGTDAAAEFLG